MYFDDQNTGFVRKSRRNWVNIVTKVKRDRRHLKVRYEEKYGEGERGKEAGTQGCQSGVPLFGKEQGKKVVRAVFW